MIFFCLKQDFQDLQDGQDEEEKVWKTLMSIERRSNKEKRSVRTLISIDPPTKKKRTLVPVARGPVPRMRRSRRCALRSYRTLLSCSCCMSIDIQVLSDLAFILAILRILEILLQTRRRNRHTEKRSGRP